MKIGVLGDTHGNIASQLDAVRFLVEKQGIGLLFHLGDDYEDADELSELDIELVRVPGIYSEKYLNELVPKKTLRTIDGKSVLAVHSTRDVSGQDRNRADIILCAHTHIYGVEKLGDAIMVNPGHLKRQMDKGQPPSFALLDVTAERILVTIYGFDHKPLLEWDSTT